MPGAFLLVTLVLGGGMGLWTLGRSEVGNGQPLLEGRWAAALERSFNARQPLREAGLAGWTALEFYGFGDARGGAFVGTQGWLFTAEELGYTPQAAQETARKLERIRQVKALLDRREVGLTVALLPAKARVYADKLEGGRLPDYVRTRYRELHSSLRALGVTTPDLLAPLEAGRARGDTFLRTDTHWTPLGASLAAGSIARAVGADLPRTATFSTSRVGFERLRGDLLNYLPLKRFSADQPAPDTLERVQTVQTGGGAMGLLDEATPPVALIGTSYSASPRWNFEGALRQALGTDVLNLSLEGRGPMAPMDAYLSSPEFRETPPRQVIWEIPERYFALPDPGG